MKIGAKLKVKGTSATAIVVGRAFIEEDGKLVERPVISLDLSTATLQDVFPLLKQVVVDYSLLEE